MTPHTPAKRNRVAVRRSQRIASLQGDSGRSTEASESASVSLSAAFSSEKDMKTKKKRSSRKRPPLADQTNNNNNNRNDSKRPSKKRKTQRALPLRTPNSKPVQPASPYTLVTNASSEQKLARSSGSDTESRSSASFSSSSASSSRSSGTIRTPLPEGVVEIYPKRRRLKFNVCSCNIDHNSAKSMGEAYIASYGYEYYKALKDIEDEQLSFNQQDYCPSPDSSTTRSVTLSATTPPGRVHVSHASASVATSTSSSRTDIDDEDGESPAIEKQPELTYKMRAILVDWLIELSVEYELSPNTLHLAVALVDRALDCGTSDDDYLCSSQDSCDSSKSQRFLISRDMFQCLGCACMLVASKIEEVKAPSVTDFVYVAADCYSKEDIIAMEMEVCTVLKFHLHQVTPFHFVEEFIRASHACRNPCCCPPNASKLRNMVYYLLELSLMPYKLSYMSPRLIAASALYLARATLQICAPSQAARCSPTGIWTKTLEHYTGFGVLELEEVVLAIHMCQGAAEESRLSNVFTKYSKPKFDQVSLKTVPREEDLGF